MAILHMLVYTDMTITQDNTETCLFNRLNNVLPLLPSGEIVLNLPKRETKSLFRNTEHCRDVVHMLQTA